ncbi:MAG: hypothetical protein IH800_04070 [Myxococcales bacterium]|nr:hypothetical protein [Myxococcales bacterium]
MGHGDRQQLDRLPVSARRLDHHACADRGPADHRVRAASDGPAAHSLALPRAPLLHRCRHGSDADLSAGRRLCVGWTPCIGPVLGFILTLAAGQDSVAQGVWLLALYSLGLGLPFLLMALSLERFFHVFARVKQHFKAIEVVSGLLLVTVGVLIVFDLLIRLNENFTFLLDFSLWLESSLL